MSAIGTPGVAGSLAAFVIVYFGVFAAGTLYILKLMGKPPAVGESDDTLAPIRTTGITPAGEGR